MQQPKSGSPISGTLHAWGYTRIPLNHTCAVNGICDYTYIFGFCKYWKLLAKLVHWLSFPCLHLTSSVNTCLLEQVYYIMTSVRLDQCCPQRFLVHLIITLHVIEKVQYTLTDNMFIETQPACVMYTLTYHML